MIQIIKLLHKFTLNDLLKSNQYEQLVENVVLSLYRGFAKFIMCEHLLRVLPHSLLERNNDCNVLLAQCGNCYISNAHAVKIISAVDIPLTFLQLHRLVIIPLYMNDYFPIKPEKAGIILFIEMQCIFHTYIINESVA